MCKLECWIRISKEKVKNLEDMMGYIGTTEPFEILWRFNPRQKQTYDTAAGPSIAKKKFATATNAWKEHV